MRILPCDNNFPFIISVAVLRQNHVRIVIVALFRVANKQSAQHYPPMFRIFIRVIIWLFRSLFKSEHDLRIENLALRQQLAVFNDKRPGPHLQNGDRAFWVALRSAWPRWTNALIIVKAGTVTK